MAPGATVAAGGGFDRLGKMERGAASRCDYQPHRWPAPELALARLTSCAPPWKGCAIRGVRRSESFAAGYRGSRMEIQFVALPYHVGRNGVNRRLHRLHWAKRGCRTRQLLQTDVHRRCIRRQCPQSARNERSRSLQRSRGFLGLFNGRNHRNRVC